MRKMLANAAMRFVPRLHRLRTERDHLLSVGQQLETAGPSFRNAWGAQPLETRPGYAVVLSAGRTATQWLASALNLHDEIFFSHGQDLQPEKRMTQEEYQTVSPRIVEQSNSFDFNDCDRYFDLLESCGSYAVYGNIHGIMSPSMFVHPEHFRRRYRVCALVRHPIVRVQSLVNKWARPMPKPWAAQFIESNKKYISRACKTYNVDVRDSDAVMFIHAVYTTFQFDGVYIRLGVPILQMERIVSDINFFLDAFVFLTSGLVKPDEGYVEKVMALGSFDATATKNQHIAYSVAHAWAPWKKAFFRTELENTGLEKNYLDLGYNVTRCL